jgi:hypothetical protein
VIVFASTQPRSGYVLGEWLFPKYEVTLVLVAWILARITEACLWPLRARAGPKNLYT